MTAAGLTAYLLCRPSAAVCGRLLQAAGVERVLALRIRAALVIRASRGALRSQDPRYRLSPIDDEWAVDRVVYASRTRSTCFAKSMKARSFGCCWLRIGKYRCNPGPLTQNVESTGRKRLASMSPAATKSAV